MRATLTLWALCCLARAGEPQEMLQDDTLSSRLITQSMLDEDPPGFRVTWIKWDSGFRGTDLRIGDRIIGVNGKRIQKPKNLRDLQQLSQTGIGSYAENQSWRSAKEGQPLTLTVRRRAPKQGTQIVEVRGTLRSDRWYKSADGTNLMGTGGPPQMSSDGFDGAWAGWYEKWVDHASRMLDSAWSSRSTSTRSELADCLEDKPRIDYLVAHHPGPFTDATRADWERLRDWLAGAAYPITAKDLEFRTLAERRVAQVAAAARAARDVMMKATAASRIEPFPAIDPIRGDRKKVVGKLVALPPITNRDWVMSSGRCFLTSGGPKKGGWYFADCNSPSTQKMLDTAQRYRGLVSPSIPETYAVIARVTDQARMLVINKVAVTGMLLDIRGAMVGDKMFVDLADPAGRFAGEAELLGGTPVVVNDKAAPAEVMGAFIAAAKEGREDAWRGLFAPWQAERSGDWVSYIANYKRRKSSEWTDTRSLLMKRVADVRVVWVSDVTRILSGKEFVKAPVVDQVGVEVDDIGKFEDGYHAFNGVAVHRRWLLQRVDGGPWRIASVQGL